MMRKFLALLLAVLMASPVHATGMLKNVAGQEIGAQLIAAADGSAFTGAVTVYVTGDGGTQGAGATSSGACAHEGNGYHSYVAAAADTNYDLIAFTFTGTGAVPVTVQVFTDESALATQTSVDEVIATLGTPTDTDIATDIANNTLTDNDIAGAVWGALRASYTTVNTFGEYAPANVTRWLGTAAATPTTAGVPEVDVTHWIGTAAATPTTAGVPEVDVTHWIGTAAATPTTAGVPEVDITHFGGVAGTFASGRPEVNTSHLAGTAYATAIGTLVDNVWDEALAGHATAGSAGAGLSAAQSAGDPWSTAIPGAYVAGTAGYIVGTNLDAAVSAAGGATAVDADIVGDAYTWIGKRYRAQNIVEVGDNFDGTLALKPDLNPNTTILTVDSVSITGAAVVTATDLEVDRSRTIAHFTVPTLTTTGTYTVVVTVTTIDGMTIPTTCTLKVY
jgi:hypothetical protein